MHRMVGRTWRGVLTPGYFEPYNLPSNLSLWGLPWWLRGREPACQCRRHWRCGFCSWVRKIPWRRKRQPIPVFSPGESHEQRSLVGYGPWGVVKGSACTEQKGAGRQASLMGIFQASSSYFPKQIIKAGQVSPKGHSIYTSSFPRRARRREQSKAAGDPGTCAPSWGNSEGSR